MAMLVRKLQLRKREFGRRRYRNFFFPYRIQNRNTFKQSVFQSRDSFTMHAICKPGVMPGNTECKQFAQSFPIPFDSNPGTGR